MNDWIVPEWPVPPHVHALVTTRAGGVSRGPYASMNLASHVGDEPAAVAENRRRLREHLPAEPLWLNQVHGMKAVCADRSPEGVVADAAFSCQAGGVCAVLTADCLPVLLCDAGGTVVGAAHAGWRGLAGGVIESALQAMKVPAPNVLAFLGPAIGPLAFEVGGEVRETFMAHSRDAAAAFVEKNGGKWFADLYLLAQQRLNALGVSRIYGGEGCTFTETERFFSFRRERATGRMASLIWLQP